MVYKKTIDISSYSLEIWRNNLSAILGKAQKILLVSDYIVPIGGTEKYIFFLRDELIKMGKEVELFGYSGSVPKWKGLWFLFVNPFSFWRFFSLRRKVWHILHEKEIGEIHVSCHSEFQLLIE